MKFEIKNRWSGKVQYSCELSAEMAGESLQEAADSVWFYSNASRLSQAFGWFATPQGDDFWRELHYRRIANGHGDVA